jgi:hypothetical protein
MSQENPIRLFVSHLYAPDDEYFRVFEYLESAVNFFYTNLSAPDKPPRRFDKESIKDGLRTQMADAEVILILTTLHARDPLLIEFQALYAQACEKPIIVMEPFGTGETVPANDALGYDRVQARLTVSALGGVQGEHRAATGPHELLSVGGQFPEQFND